MLIWGKTVHVYEGVLAMFSSLVLSFSTYIGYSHDTLQTLTYGQDRFRSITHIWIQLIYLLLASLNL